MVNNAFNQFHTKLLDMINEHVPVRTRTISEKKFRCEPWLTNGLTTSIAKCKKLYKKSIVSHATEHDIQLYKNYRNCLNS